MCEQTNQQKAINISSTFIFSDFAMHIRERLMLLVGSWPSVSKPEEIHAVCSLQALGFDSVLRVMSYLDDQSLYRVSCTSR